MRSVGNISSAPLSVRDTGTPEFVNRIYAPRLLLEPRDEIKRGHTTQGVSGVSGLTSLPAMWGKLDNVSLSATLNLSMSKISGTTWEVGTYSVGSVKLWGISSRSGGHTAHDKRRSVDDISWYFL